MRDKEPYARILGIKSPWQVSGVELVLSEGEVTVHVEQKKRARSCCPTRGEVAPGYDSRTRRWRHLDTCQYKTILAADVPRVNLVSHARHTDVWLRIQRRHAHRTNQAWHFLAIHPVPPHLVFIANPPRAVGRLLKRNLIDQTHQ